MPTKKIPCECCDGSGLSIPPAQIEELRTRIENIKAAMAADDADKLQANLEPKPPARLRGRAVTMGINRKDPLAGSNLQARGRHGLLGLAAWVQDLEKQQGPCEHCAGAGEFQHRALGWEVVEGVVAEAADGTVTVKASRTWRCRVPGGWMVKTTASHTNGIGVGLTFVPDPDHTWEP
jgi:hypothetical protein